MLDARLPLLVVTEVTTQSSDIYSASASLAIFFLDASPPALLALAPLALVVT